PILTLVLFFLLILPPPPRSSLFPYTTLFRSISGPGARQLNGLFQRDIRLGGVRSLTVQINAINLLNTVQWAAVDTHINSSMFGQDRKSTRLNSSHDQISYAVFCLKKKKNNII